MNFVLKTHLLTTKRKEDMLTGNYVSCWLKSFVSLVYLVEILFLTQIYEQFEEVHYF